ncbi:NAD-dependent succinate-semialdehyde dehydrogenase [Gilvimarinus sp. DA14]|uniref:NAD-dependent succinate-semialdehyde dehydrogenase n=1 Tax=Gilvimarinus sp. DA14 TaxID=2956798 RepID=UPI0020B8373A|nr:NAD-dependent succinate-semialdehyde dehydrogenase [Gilvimarinus sp. DA14]
MDIALQDSRLFRQACYSNGEWVSDGNAGSIEVVNPATDEVIGRVPSLDEGQVSASIAAAAEGFASWRKMSVADRSACLRRWFELMHEHKEDLARIMTLEQGKPISESLGEIDYAASYIEWFTEEAKRGYGEVIPAVKANQRIVVRPEPVGVSVAITPWNFPAAMITRKAAAALAAGCSMLVKPSSLTPFSALALAELGERAGLPAGVFSVLTGSSSVIGEVFTQSTTVKKLSFTGSTEVGRKLMAMCADNLHKLSLELGGNAPFVVFDDADLDLAVKGALAAKFRNTGQTCICPNRFLVQAGVHDAFVDKLSAALSEFKVGDGFAEDVKQTSLINADAVKKVQRHYDDALEHGAKVVLGERPGALANNRVAPIVLTGLTADMQIWQEETFGPLAPVMKFDSEQEGIDAANDTPFGLAAYFYASNNDRVWRVSEALQAGMVGANEGGISNAMAPFGGIDQSGFGREGGRQGMAEYQQLKYVCFGESGPTM